MAVHLARKHSHHFTQNAVLHPACSATHPIHIKEHKSQLPYAHMTVHNPLYNISTYTYYIHRCA